MVHVCDFVFQWAYFCIQLVTLIVLALELLLCCLCLLFILLSQSVFVCIQLLDLSIEELDLCQLSSLHFFVVLLETEVVHLSIALVTNSVGLGVLSGQLSPCLRTDIAYGVTTPLAVTDRVLAKHTGEGGLTQMTLLLSVPLHSLHMESFW